MLSMQEVHAVKKNMKFENLQGDFLTFIYLLCIFCEKSRTLSEYFFASVLTKSPGNYHHFRIFLGKLQIKPRPVERYVFV